MYRKNVEIHSKLYDAIETNIAAIEAVEGQDAIPESEGQEYVPAVIAVEGRDAYVINYEKDIKPNISYLDAIFYPINSLGI